MKRFLLGLILALSYVGAQGAHPDILANDLKDYVKYLASDECEGRLSLGPGATKASAYIADRFKKFGLKPMGDKGTYFYSFDMSIGYQIGRGTSLSMTSKGKTKRFTVRKEFVPVGFGMLDKRVKGDCVFLGYGISAPAEGWDDYAGANVRDKVVLVIRGAPKELAERLDEQATTMAKAKAAAEHGAVAILFAGSPNSGQAELMSLQGANSNAVPIVATSIRAAVADEILKATGKTLVEQRDAIEATRAFKAIETRSTVEVRSEVTRREGKARDVIGFLEGTDPKLKDEIIVFGGHYDHLGYGETGAMDAPNSDIHYGADDNASGTAAVMELAEKFAHDRKNKRSMLFMAFAGEEEGLVGSAAFCAKPTVDLSKVTAMINCDMVGRLAKNTLVIAGVGTSPSFPNLLDKLNTDKFKLSIEMSGLGPSDHASFYRKDIPVLFFFTATHPDYHRHTDTWDKLNYAGEEKIAKYVYRIANAIDSDNQKLAFTPSGGFMRVADQSSFTEDPKPTSPPNDEDGPPRRRVMIGFEPDYSDTSGNGLLLSGVRENSPAERAGIKGGDRVIKWNGKPVRDIEDLAEYMSRANPGQQVTITVLRSGKELDMKVIPETPGS